MTITEIESAIENPPSNEFEKLARWFEQFQERVWDKQIERDLQNGNLQSLLEEAEKDFVEGNCQPL